MELLSLCPEKLQCPVPLEMLVVGSERIQKFADGIYGRSLEEFHLMIVTEVDGPLQRSIKNL